jgi:hypothetical protein
MDIVMRHSDSVRIITDQGNNFIDVNGMEWEQGIRVDGYPHFHYIELREKEGHLSTFYFRNKRAKHGMDLGWWQDAEVVFARNDVRHARTK